MKRKLKLKTDLINVVLKMLKVKSKPLSDQSETDTRARLLVYGEDLAGY